MKLMAKAKGPAMRTEYAKTSNESVACDFQMIGLMSTLTIMRKKTVRTDKASGARYR
jgi:hypothetical protein